MTISHTKPGVFSTPITQVNVGKKCSAMSSLFKDIKTNEILILQEPLVRNNRIGNAPKSHRQFIPHSKDRARVAILLPSDLAKKSMILDTFSTADSIALRIRIDSKTTIILVNIYMDITKPVPTDIIYRLSRFAESESLPLVVATDSNAHHTAWGHRSCNSRGRDLLLSLSANNLVLANTGNIPTFRSKVGNSVIDLTFTNISGSNLINSWHVDVRDSISGHETLRYNLELGSVSSSTTRCLAKCDWALYRELVEQAFKDKPYRFQPVATVSDLNKRQHFIDSILTECFNKACPLIQVKRKSAVPWWSAELTKAKINTKLLKRKAYKSNSGHDWDAYKSQNTQYKNLIKSSKRQGWKSFTQNIQGCKPSARISKILNFNPNKSGNLNSLKKPDGTLTTSPQETLEVLADNLLPDEVRPSTHDSSDSPTSHTPDHARINTILSFSRLDRAINVLNANKAPGPDGIRNSMLIHAWPWIRAPLRNLMYHSLALNATPRTWHEANGCITGKPFKTDYTEHKSFRVISLTACCQKLLERLVLWHLEEDVGIPAYLTKNQHGFRKGASTESALHNLIRRIEDANSKQYYSLGIFLDIEGAFDNISFSAIKSALINSGIPPSISEWIYHMVSNRYITLNHCGHTLRRRSTKGSPQGGVLSPLLWNITLNSFFEGLGTNSDFVQAFADDLVILVRGFCKSTLVDIAQSLVDNLSHWCSANGLKLSALKTKVVLFTRKRDNSLPRPIIIDGKPIIPSSQVTYLGTLLDAKLSWAPHTESKVTHGISMVFACKKAIGKTWGLPPKVMRWIYNIVILPSVLYGTLFWHHTLEYRLYTRQKFEQLQRHAALSITRGLNSTHSANIEILAGLQPINLKVQEIAIMTALRLKLNNKWDPNYEPDSRPSYISHAYSVDKLLSQVNIFKGKLSDWIPTELILDRKFSVSVKPREIIEEYITSLPPTTWQIYTDGSKQGRLSGAGFCVLRNDQEHTRNSYNLGIYPTVFQCEVYALYMGSIWAKLNIPPSGRIVFLSDSVAAIRALDSSKVGSHLVLDSIKSLNQLGSSHHVEITWIPGHSNYKGNELADKLAREGSSVAPIGPEPFMAVSKRVNDSLIKDFMYGLHIKQYNNLNISSKGKSLLSIWLRNHRYKLIPISGIHLKWLTWLLSGHSPLAYFQHTSGKYPSPDCQHCPGYAETSVHFLAECTEYATPRLRTFGVAITTIEHILSFKTDKIIDFITLTDRFNENHIFK